MHVFRSLLIALVALSSVALAAPRVQPVPVPDELRSRAFTLTVNGVPVDVAHAAASLDFANFDITGPVDIAITAADSGFWDKGVDIQPWRLGLRATRNGATIHFRLDAPAKLAISRPRDFLNHAAMLFLFAGTPPAPPPPGAQVFPAGIHRESLNPKSGDTLYLAPGSVFFGSLNLWKVENVHVLGRGLIVYDGPQDPKTDEGWMQKPDWHCIGSMDARNIEVQGVTCVVRSRTWSVQLKDSDHILFDDLRVVGGNPGNANQDGIDWIGSSDGLVRNSFFRASDDTIALMGNWDGYTDDDMLRPGRDVRNITVENSELSTSISNIVRSGWPRKTFNSSGFTLRNSDILHAGIGACVQPFALLGTWANNGARGEHSGYTFENLFLDDWYSLVQIEQQQPAIRDLTFRNIWALDQPPLIPSSIAGSVSGVIFDNIKLGRQRLDSAAALPLTVSEGAAAPAFPAPAATVARFTVSPAAAEPGTKLSFTAGEVPHANYTWLFGDGTRDHGRRVKHRFPDAAGTELSAPNGAGRFRVILHVESRDHKQQDWAAQGVVVVSLWQGATSVATPLAPGLNWQIYPGSFVDLPNFAHEKFSDSGSAPGLTLDTHGYTRFAAAWDGYIDAPADGGYTFHLLARDGARLVIDGLEVARTGPPFSQVCGALGNAVRYDRGSIGLMKGIHTIHIEGLRTASDDLPRLLWEGPNLPLADMPSSAFRRQP
ncbi:MAG: PA14 domain-containing protein [Terracidiphilus sp.]|nr:PA14 domain-containing protein [Terracidiphilus sp.]